MQQWARSEEADEAHDEGSCGGGAGGEANEGQEGKGWGPESESEGAEEGGEMAHSLCAVVPPEVLARAMEMWRV